MKIIFIIFFAFCLSCFVSAEDILLKNGSMLRGSVLKKGALYFFVDMGFGIVSVPLKDIKKISKRQENEATVSNPGKHIYSEKRLSYDTVAKAAGEFSSSVVVVKRYSGGLGSGFFIDTDGYLVTNFHVIKNERHFTVIRFVKDKHETRRIMYDKVRIVAVDPLHDLAVLKIEEDLQNKIIPVVFSPDDSCAVGDTVFAIGTPLGLEQTVTEGILSHKTRMFRGLIFLQIDAPVNPGNSGGPLFNAHGEVIGVNNMGAAKHMSEGLNFAIPIRDVKFLLDHLEAFAFNESNPETGFVYCFPPPKKRNEKTSKMENKKK